MAIAGQMGEQLRQSSRSVNIRERLDFSCALVPPVAGYQCAPHSGASRLMGIAFAIFSANCRTVNWTRFSRATRC